MKKIDIPENVSRKELFAFLLQNKKALIQQKKMEPKEGVGIPYFPTVLNERKKALPTPTIESGVLAVKVAVNTSNWMDSCKDFHIPGLWKKTLSENKMLMHLQEHDMQFEKIIADGEDLAASTKNMTWAELGYPEIKGVTEALIFDSMVRKSRNSYMYDQYLKGYVKNHSVYMQYIKMVMCINEPDDVEYGAEYEAWQKYYPLIANKDYADEVGYGWAILEAKLIEGSAVPIGANIVTPTISVESKSNQPPKRTESKSIYSLNIGASKYKVGKYSLDLNKM